MMGSLASEGNLFEARCRMYGKRFLSFRYIFSEYGVVILLTLLLRTALDDKQRQNSGGAKHNDKQVQNIFAPFRSGQRWPRSKRLALEAKFGLILS